MAYPLSPLEERPVDPYTPRQEPPYDPATGVYTIDNSSPLTPPTVAPPVQAAPPPVPRSYSAPSAPPPSPLTAPAPASQAPAAPMSNWDILARGGVPDDWLTAAAQPAKTPEKGFIGKLGQAFGGGVDTLQESFKATGNALIGDNRGVEANAATMQQVQQAKPQEQQAFMQGVEAIPENLGFVDTVKGLGSAIWEQPQGALQEFVAQAPNSAAVIGGMVAGGKLGAMAGSVVPGIGNAIGAGVGAIIGGFLGNMGIEAGAKVIEKAEGGLTDAERGAGLQEGALKAAGVTGVDMATLGASRWLMGAPSRAASSAITNYLTKAGVDVADDAAVATAMNTLGVGSEALLNGAREFARSAGRAPLRTAGAAVMETVGEGAGEYLGEVMATGEGSIKDALLESIMSAPMSAAEIAWSKSDAGQPFKLGTALSRATGTDLRDPEAVDRYINTNIPQFAALSLDQDRLGIVTKDVAMQALGDATAPMEQRIQAIAGIAADIAVRQKLPEVSKAWRIQAQQAMEKGETIEVPGYTKPIPAYQQQQQADRKREKTPVWQRDKASYPLTPEEERDSLIRATMSQEEAGPWGQGPDLPAQVRTQLDQVNQRPARIDNQMETPLGPVNRDRLGQELPLPTAGQVPGPLGRVATEETAIAQAEVNPAEPTTTASPLTMRDQEAGHQAEAETALAEEPTAQDSPLTAPQRPAFTPTHSLSDGTPVRATAQPGIYEDQDGAEIEDNYADPLPASPLTATTTPERTAPRPDPETARVALANASGVMDINDRATAPELADRIRKTYAQDNPRNRAMADAVEALGDGFVVERQQGVTRLLDTQQDTAQVVAADEQLGKAPVNRRRPANAIQQQLAENKARRAAETAPPLAPPVTNPNPKARTPIYTPDGQQFAAQWEVVEADDLTPAMTTGENQPRDRNRLGSDLQIQTIANNPDFKRLSDIGQTMDVGAPTLTREGVIVGGNGRVAGVTRSYDIGKAQAYREALTARAEELGVDPAQIAGMNKPVLVRRLQDEVDVGKMALASNQSQGLAMASTETAKVDAGRLRNLGQLAITDTGDIATTNDNIARLRDSLTDYDITEQAAFIDDAGSISADGLRRVRNAILHQAYGDSPVLKRLLETADPDLKNVSTALIRAGGKMAEMNDVITRGEVPADYAVATDMAQAIETLSQLRQSKTSLADHLSQQDIFGDQASPAEQRILKFLDDNGRSAKAITGFLEDYADRIISSKGIGQDLFGDTITPPTKDQVLADVAQRNAKSAAPTSGDLFAQAPAGQAAGQPQDAGNNAPGDRQLGGAPAPGDAISGATAAPVAPPATQPPTAPPVAPRVVTQAQNQLKAATKTVTDLTAKIARLGPNATNRAGLESQLAAAQGEVQAAQAKVASHTRAPAGGGYGANGEWYPAGAFINTVPDNAKGTAKTRAATGKQQVAPGVYEAPAVAGQQSLFARNGATWQKQADGTMAARRDLNPAEYPPEVITAAQQDADRYNAGERWGEQRGQAPTATAAPGKYQGFVADTISQSNSKQKKVGGSFLTLTDGKSWLAVTPAEKDAALQELGETWYEPDRAETEAGYRKSELYNTGDKFKIGLPAGGSGLLSDAIQSLGLKRMTTLKRGAVGRVRIENPDTQMGYEIPKEIAEYVATKFADEVSDERTGKAKPKTAATPPAIATPLANPARTEAVSQEGAAPNTAKPEAPAKPKVRTAYDLTDEEYQEVIADARYLKDVAYSISALVGDDPKVQLAMGLSKSMRDTILMDALNIDRDLAHTVNNGLDDKQIHKLRKQDMEEALVKFPMLKKLVDEHAPKPAVSEKPAAETEAVTQATLEDLQLYRKWGDAWQYKTQMGSTWLTANTQQDALDRATAAYHKTPAEDRLTSQQRFDKANQDEMAEMQDRYGRLSLAELQKQHAAMGGTIAGLQESGEREFNGNGGRRSGPAMAAQGSRETAEERSKLGRYITWRQEQAKAETKPTSAKAATPTAPTDKAQEKAADTKLENFGEALPPRRRKLAAKLTEALSDDDIASQPLSKIWPAAENEGIEDTFAAAVAFAARAKIPSKPRGGGKLILWVEQVKLLRTLAGQIVSGKVNREQFLDLRKRNHPRLSDWEAQVRLLEQLDREHWSRIAEVHQAPDSSIWDDKSKSLKPSAYVTVKIDGQNRILSGSGEILQHLDAIKALLGEAAATKLMQFTIWSPRSGGSFYIAKNGDPEKRKLMTFDSVAEARTALRDRYADLVTAWEAVKERDNITERDLRGAVNRPRTGQDWRQGRDITTEEFANQFGFRGGEFGKWMKQGSKAQERQAYLNSAYDALMDLADILGVPPKAISLNGTLGMAFGARGSGWAAAHYEPDTLIINLTKPHGAGALAHEWFHALDNYFARTRGNAPKFTGDQDAYRDQNFITYKPERMMVHKSGRVAPLRAQELTRRREQNPGANFYAEEHWQLDPQHPEGVRPEVEARFAALVEALNASPMLDRARRLDGRKSGEGYWSRVIERGARAFENYVMKRMLDQGYVNDFLANILPATEVDKNDARYPYLLPDEVAPIAEAFDDLLGTLQTREDAAGNVAMFSRSSAKALPATITVDGVERSTTNSDGKPIHSTAEGVRKFWKWFGDSEVVDSKGRPLLAYHGTNADFSVFDEAKLGEATNSRTTALGFFSTDNNLVANIFADSPDGANVMPIYVSIKNAFEIGFRTASERTRASEDPFTAMRNAIARVAGKPWSDVTKDDVIAWKDRLIGQGYDGIILRNTSMDSAGGATARTIKDPYHDFHISFQPQQIKSAIGNSGAFDPTNPDIRFQTGTATPGASPTAVRAAVNRITRHWANAPEMVVFTGMDDPQVDARVRAEYAKQTRERLAKDPTAAPDQVDAFYFRGKVYINSASIANIADLERAVRHETLGHAGLRALFGNALNGILDQVIAGQRAAVEAKAKQRGLKMDKLEEARTAAEEVLAELAETRPNLAVVRRAVALIRRLLREMGITLELSNNDLIAEYILPARNFIERGQRQGTGTGGLVPAFNVSEAATAREFRETEARYAAELKAHDEKQQPLPAPNGQRSKLNRRQWVQVRTPAFKAWFGDWEAYAGQPGGVWNDGDGKVSKVVDENGEPRVVYHGSKKAGFTVLDPSKGDQHRSPMVFTAKSLNTAASYAGTREEVEMADSFGPTTQEGFEKLGYEFDEDGDFWGVTDPNGNVITSVDDERSREEALDMVIADYEEWGASYNEPEENSGIYPLFLNLRNPNERDFGGANWDGQRLGGDSFSIWDSENEEYVDGSDFEPMTEEDARARYEELGGDDEEFDGRPRYEVQEAPDMGETTNSVAEEGIRMGNDGAYITSVVDDGGQYYQADVDDVMVIFNANQAKSATQNTGAFSAASDDLRFRLSPRQSQTLESAWQKLSLAPERQKTLSEHVRELLGMDWQQARRDRAARDYEGLLDGLINIDRAEQEVGITKFEQRGYISTRMAAGKADVMWGILNKGAPEWRNGVMSYKRGTQGLLKTLGELGPDMRDWLGWMAGNRARELLATDREHNLDEAEIADLIALATPDKAAKFMKAKAEYSALNTAMLDVAETAGLIDPTARAKWQSEWYVPFYRVREADGEATLLGPHTRGGLSHQSSGIRALKGGEAPTGDLLENILTNWMKLLDASLKNHALEQISTNLTGTRFMEDETTKYKQIFVSKTELLQRLKEDPQLVAAVADWLGAAPGDVAYTLKEVQKLTRRETENLYAQVWTKVAPEGKDIVRVQRKGQNHYYKVLDPALLRSIESFAFEGFNDPLTRTARYFKRLLTTGVTAMPDFIVRNFIRDAVQAWTINPDKMRFASSAIKGLRRTYGESDAYWDLIFSGGAFQGGYVHGTDPDASAQMIRRSLGRKGLSPQQIAEQERGVLRTAGQAWAVLDKYWEKYRAWGDKAENVNRLATYEAALAAGKSPLQAAFEAKDLMDYSLRGNYQALIRFTDMIPFLNARIQGLGKLGRAGLADPRVVGIKLAQIAAFSVALALLNGDDDRYKELEDWQKDAYWHFWLGEEHFRIPKPFEVGVVAGTLPERMWHVFAGNQENEKLWWSVKHNLMGTFGFNPIPQIALPAIENVANRSFFYDKPIENLRDQGQLPANRFDSRTSDSMRVLGSWLGTSPKQMEHLVNGYLGTLGMYVLGLSDAVVRWGTDAPAKPDAPLGTWPVLRTIYQGSGPARNTVYATDLYDAFQEVEMIHRTINDMRKEKRLDQAKALQTEAAPKLRLRPQLLAAKKRLDEINRSMTRITDSTMSGTMKRQRLDRLTAEKNRLSQKVAGRIEGVF